MIVLDASAVIELLLGTRTGVAVARRIAPFGESLHVPHLIDLEVAQALRRYARSGQISEGRAVEDLEDLADLDLNRYAHNIFMSRIWALRRNTTAYDAAYLALAESLPAPLLTADARLKGIPGIRARIEVV